MAGTGDGARRADERRARTTAGGASATYEDGRQHDGAAGARGMIAGMGRRRASGPGSSTARDASSAKRRRPPPRVHAL